MELKELSKRAVEIKKRYSQMEMKKFGKEWTDAQVMQGFVGDVGDLMKLVMAKEGIREVEDVDNKLAHELADCLYSVFVLADRYEVDIEKSFLDTMGKLDKRLESYKK
ncbi:MAG: MazG nucleotide pyrophosphohydrolase domain-containing protein [Leadbetterella sp.]|nr:MazG nucleotide pyrophosphohydrolase domain-containing protein [Leadbetterella sp.]